MTSAQKNSLGFAVRLSHGYCLDQATVLTKWLAENPDVEPVEARSFISMCHGVPFPSIRGRKEGPFPIYREAPYLDARAWLDNKISAETLDEWVSHRIR